MDKYFNIHKEKYRGTIKQIMKVYRLRTISISNYKNWKHIQDNTGYHSIKLDIQDGYVNLYEYGKNGKCGEALNNVTTEQYKNAYDIVMQIIEDAQNIPFKVKRNILVKVTR